MVVARPPRKRGWRRKIEMIGQAVFVVGGREGGGGKEG